MPLSNGRYTCKVNFFSVVRTAEKESMPSPHSDIGVVQVPQGG